MHLSMYVMEQWLWGAVIDDIIGYSLQVSVALAVMHNDSEDETGSAGGSLFMEMIPMISTCIFHEVYFQIQRVLQGSWTCSYFTMDNVIDHIFA